MERLLISILLLAALILLVLWDIAIRVFKVPPYLIPPPLAVVKQLFTEWPMLLRETSATMEWLTTDNRRLKTATHD
jgi:ABC-type nitrate/sulfonate/bicarbonate transport system permease component